MLDCNLLQHLLRLPDTVQKSELENALAIGTKNATIMRTLLEHLDIDKPMRAECIFAAMIYPFSKVIEK